MVAHPLKKFLIGMKTLKESLFDRDLIKRGISIDGDTVLYYIEQKANEAKKKGINVEIDNTSYDQHILVSFKSKELFCPDDYAVESYHAMFVVDWYDDSKYPKDNYARIQPWIVYGLTKGINWNIRPRGPGMARHVDTLKLMSYITSDIGGVSNMPQVVLKKPEEIYKVIDGYFEIFEKLNDYRLFDGWDDVEDISQGKLNNQVYNKLKKIWPDVPKLMR